jgi:K+-transporting ATPase ATPase A chain
MTLAFGLLLFAVTALIAWPLGRYLGWALGLSRHDRFDRALERALGWGSLGPQTWKRYALSLLVFNALMFTFVFVVLVCQQWLPLNPDGKGPLEPSLAFNTAMSFTTNTNLQHYSGEQSLSYFTQIFCMAWLQFVSAATGIAALAAMARALGPKREIGNFYRDLARATVLVLLPLSVVVALLLTALGMPMTLDGAAIAHTMEGAVQTIARGPVAAMVTIKQLGTNGGGYFGPNSTHPFENPSFYTNLIENIAILLLPMACVWMFGRLAGRIKHAAVVFGVMTVVFLALSTTSVLVDAEPNAAFTGLPVDQTLGNLEGKELRIGTPGGAFWAVSTTATSNGSVSAMHDSLNPLAGLMPMIGMWLNVTFGGVGVGFINMFLYIVVAVFIAGLMVGRTPEYLGRKIEAREMKLAALALLLHPLLILGGTAIFAATSWGTGTIANPGSHGFSEILYEFSSASANNGSGFEGLGDNTVPWNVATGIAMLLGRFLPIILPLAIAGFLSEKKIVPETAGTFRTDSPLFGVLLLGSVLLLGALLFLPAAVLGPIAEHLTLVSAAGVAP